MTSEEVTDKLQAAQTPIERYLWVPEDAITFTPAVLARTFGDGRALFGFSTVQNRPAYWIVRRCSTWCSALDFKPPHEAPDFDEFAYKVMDAIEEEFGASDQYEYCSRCGRWRNPETWLFVPKSWVEYPVIDPSDGCHWFRLDWPEDAGISVQPHPFARTNVLAT